MWLRVLVISLYCVQLRHAFVCVKKTQRSGRVDLSSKFVFIIKLIFVQYDIILFSWNRKKSFLVRIFRRRNGTPARFLSPIRRTLLYFCSYWSDKYFEKNNCPLFSGGQAIPETERRKSSLNILNQQCQHFHACKGARKERWKKKWWLNNIKTFSKAFDLTHSET